MSEMFGTHAEMLAATYRTAVVLIETAGAFTTSALRDALPFSGYAMHEVDEALDVLVGAGDLVASPLDLQGGRLFLPGRNWPIGGTKP